MPRLALIVKGVVQGVGFRPFVYRQATSRGLSGWVRNCSNGVEIEIQGPENAIDAFTEGLLRERPAAARIAHLHVETRVEVPPTEFRILASAPAGVVRPSIPADLAICADCVLETETPGLRRHLYPFTNCTQCGPRYSLIESAPYDRANTSMKGFAMCEACASEYEDPPDRRFHAEPIACPTCGPRVRLVLADGRTLEADDAALRKAAAAVREGKVVAVKSVGGFHLVADACSADAVALLRRRKHRDEKPFAVMFASLDGVRNACTVSAREADALQAPEAPIVLLRRLARECARVFVAEAVAPGNPFLGVLLPYTPIHRRLLDLAARPLVCTSGNLSDEPMCTEEDEARDRLGSIADLFLGHDRPIVRPVDDSVVRVGHVGLEVLRRARGFAPLPLPLCVDAQPVLALGGQLKSTAALFFDRQVVVSQHLGDLHSHEGANLLQRTAMDLVRFFAVRPTRLACDLHPDYASTRLAERLASSSGVPLVRVQHHHAHVAACVAEHALSGPVLGLAWDGAGYGLDGTIWGGEALVVYGPSFRRIAHLRSFPLPGGERAFREPRRAALGLLWELLGEGARAHVTSWFSEAEVTTLMSLLRSGTNCPRTTSIGRLFDAVSALAGVRTIASFEGQAAMDLEFAAEGAHDKSSYPLPLVPGRREMDARSLERSAALIPDVVDFDPLVRALLDDRHRGAPAGVIAARFHNALVALAAAIAASTGIQRVVLSGGCFQNRILASSIRERLDALGFDVYSPRLYPPNDGGLSLGQALVAAMSHPDEYDVPRNPR